MGVAEASTPGILPRELLKRADTDLYEKKNSRVLDGALSKPR